jgi:membrane fusion protein, multidrug efflux system
VVASKRCGQAFLGGVLLGLMLFSLTACMPSADALRAFMKRPPPLVATAAATTRDVPIYLEEIGKCVAREVVSVQPQVSGQIIDIHFGDGADVKRGDRLFTIDPRPFRAALELAQGNLAQEKAVLALAHTAFARGQRLLPKDAIARTDYDQLENAVAVAEARVKSAAASVDTARLNLEYCSICSSIDGRTGHRLVDKGNVVTAASMGPATPLVTIERPDPIYADFTIAENDLLAVQQSMKQGSVKTEVWLPDSPRNIRTGDLAFVDNAVQDGTGTVMLRATLPNADHYLWPGRFVKIRLILRTIKNAVVIPVDAPQESAKGPFVYVVGSDSKAELRHVKLGQRHGESIVVEQGLKAGERIITLGQIAVMPGGDVRVEGAAPATGKPPTEKPAPAKSAAEKPIANKPASPSGVDGRS